MTTSSVQRLDLDCGIAHERIASWLDDELALPAIGGAWLFTAKGGTCTVRIDALKPRTLGPFELERARLQAWGDADALAAFKRLFILRFASAGG